MKTENDSLRFRHYARSDESIRLMLEEIVGHHPAHSHDDFIEIVYVVSGRGEQTINGVSERIEKGDLYLFDAQVEHSFTADPDAPLTVRNCLFLPTAVGLSGEDCRDFLDVAWRFLFYSPVSESSSLHYMKLTGISASEIRDTLSYMASEYDKRENGYLQILKAELVKLLILLFRRFSATTPQQQRQYYHRLIVEEARTYIKQHYNENVTCELLAERAYLSVNYFRELFRKITGMTVIDALQQIRVEEACRLLKSTDLTVARVAEAVGYSDVKFFYSVFREQMGATPGAYRSKVAAKHR